MSRKNHGQETRQAQNRLSPLETMLAQRSMPMLGLCFFALSAKEKEEFPCREFLKKLNAEAATVEELADYYGTQKNEQWFGFRESVAAQKLFTTVIYDMLHLQHSIERYRLLKTSGNLSLETRKTIKQLRNALLLICENLISQAKEIGIIEGFVPTEFEHCNEPVFDYMLPSDRSVRHVSKVGETVVYLATQFLNLSEDREVEELLKPRESCDFEEVIPHVIDEEKCRLVETRFHNLQSLYDTYIFESDLESQNKNLPYLRGHISIIFHLLENATSLIHYYIRHMSKLSRSASRPVVFPLSTEGILGIVFNYLFFYARDYLNSAVHLCKTMIQSYSEVKTISVPIPNYRGFHVRPSTLISKIVAHYGSSVRMILDDHVYNAGSTLDLFRANEAINAMKRRYIADLLSKKSSLQQPIPEDRDSCRKELQILFLEMMKKGEIMIYEPSLPFDDIQPVPGESMADLASRCIKHFQSLAKVDVSSKLKVSFEGDNRALNDLKILADNGYGEDRFGNNIVLPAELSYLRR
ncbi:MAG: HPr family phosphocarrier protein [Spirochaetota bacterium]|nr:HPr family phosphocarrier protein [Spirochaetota bacterium]